MSDILLMTIVFIVVILVTAWTWIMAKKFQEEAEILREQAEDERYSSDKKYYLHEGRKYTITAVFMRLISIGAIITAIAIIIYSFYHYSKW